MVWNAPRTALGALILSLLMLACLPAGASRAAGAEEVRSTCRATGNLSEDIVAVARAPERWICADANYSLEGERSFLRFDIDAGKPLPHYLFSRRSALEAVHLLVIDRNGQKRQASVAASDLQSALQGGYFKVPLPALTDASREVIVAFDLPSHRMTLERAFLAPSDLPLEGGFLGSLVILAVLAGMLSMPLLFNAAFYRILREPFVLWHSALTISLLLTILTSSGLAVILFDPPAMILSWMTTLIFGATVASGAMFTATFIEQDRLHPLLRRALRYSAVAAVTLSLLHAAFPFVARPVQSTLYTAAFAPILGVFVLSVADALRRKSRAAKFQAVGYIPVILAGLIRLVTGVLPWLESNDAMLLFYVGCVCEVLFTTLGVADRFMAIRRQRDQARFEAEGLKQLAERDALTGLFNRRAMEQNFETHRAEGYRALAVLDLDHFKTINDVHGHDLGDAVLKAVAEALQGDPQIQAFRFGGEEFILLIRGEDAQLRAERRRQAIPAAIANAVPGLANPVTASMGLTDMSGNADVGFADFYRQADKLLYDAKGAGRNRSKVMLVSEVKDQTGHQPKAAAVYP